MKLLLVEDDPELGASLHGLLPHHGYETTWVRDTSSARRFIDSEAFDLVVLDVRLPDGSGIEVLRWMREHAHREPVLMLTALNSIADRVLGLDEGADDYLAKPFAVEELLSRIRALLRRKSDQRSAIWSIGVLSIDTSRRRVQRGAHEITLSPKEYVLLTRLAANPGVVLTRAQLARGTEPDVSLGAIDVHIHSLRRKLGADLISTLRGVGYVLERIDA